MGSGHIAKRVWLSNKGSWLLEGRGGQPRPILWAWGSEAPGCWFLGPGSCLSTVCGHQLLRSSSPHPRRPAEAGPQRPALVSRVHMTYFLWEAQVSSCCLHLAQPLKERAGVPGPTWLCGSVVRGALVRGRVVWGKMQADQQPLQRP